MGDVLAYSGAMRRLAVELGKIASDLRLLSMGPRAGLAEIALPAVQPGSSIMPGKVNPSIPEMVNQVCFQVMGCDLTVAMACEAGQLELNVMMPVIAWNALHASQILRESMRRFERAASTASSPIRSARRELLDRSTAVATALSPLHRLRGHGGDREGIGAHRHPDSPVARERELLEPQQLERMLDPEAMTRPASPDRGAVPSPEGEEQA